MEQSAGAEAETATYPTIPCTSTPAIASRWALRKSVSGARRSRHVKSLQQGVDWVVDLIQRVK